MPPKPTKTSTSQAIVSTGPKQVAVHSSSKQKREHVEKQTTTRALVLRNGKYGAMGTGEIMLISKMTGKEKLDLLAEDLIKKSETAIATPFRLEKCLKIAESQYDVYLDDVAALKDPELFRHAIESEVNARTPPKAEPRWNATHVAKIVGMRIHNSYMLASAWKIVSETLNSLAHEGITDRNIKIKLKNNPELRERYLVLFDMINALVEMSHARVSVLATFTPHYAPYFKPKPAGFRTPGEEVIIFDWQGHLRDVTESFLDNIVMELCFPCSPIPRAIIYELLREAIEESPREAKRFPQAMWDAIGDLSESVQLQTQVEAVLFGPDGTFWRNQPRTMPEEYEQWVDGQLFSEKASAQITNWKDIIFPLATTKRKEVLENMWKTINSNYQSVSGHEIDALWQLEGEMNPTPQWTPYFIPSLAEEKDDEDVAHAPRFGSLKPKPRNNPKRQMLAIKDGNESTGSMPDLQSVSDTSEGEEEEEEEDDDDDDESVLGDGASDGSGYNTEEEDEMRDMLREAMDAGLEADWFDTSKNVPAGIDPLKADDGKGNPFLKLLGSLRGRMFNSNPKLKTVTRTEPRSRLRGAFRSTPSGVPKEVPSGVLPPKPVPQPAKDSQPKPPEPKIHKTTLEEVDDEDAVRTTKKKKKKTKKKKTPASPHIQNSPPPTSHNPVQTHPTPPKPPVIPQVLSATPKPPAASQAASMPAKKASSTTQTQTSPLAPSLTKSDTSHASSSTLHIPVETTTAQSAHAYLRSLDPDAQKTKIKSRPDHASLFSNSEKEKSSKSLFSKFKKSEKTNDQSDGSTPKTPWYSRLDKKATDLMHRLLKTSEEAGQQAGSMKWDQFLNLMRRMRFDYDPSTAGSSVRFDPPNKNDKPISIHRPHPDPTLTPIMLRKIAKRLQRHYGWNEEDFMKQTAAATV